MSGLIAYLVQKRAALLALRDKLRSPDTRPRSISAAVTAEGRSGVRRIRIRDHQVITDSPRDFAGYELGPSSPELQLGVLGSCLTHTWLIQAADLEVPLEAIEVVVDADFDARGNILGAPDVPVTPQNLRYTVKVTSSASHVDLERLQAAVERFCPILNLLKAPQTITATIERTTPGVLSDAAS